MKRTVALALAVILIFGVVICGCAPKYDKSPDQFEDIRWITNDYSFCIEPENDCAGFYNYNGKKYNIKVTFDSSRLSAVDTDNGDTELFYGDWTYEDDGGGKDRLLIYNIVFNKDDYEELKGNYAEFASLKQEDI